ncbi:MAG: hypothetical protein UV15_C0029G0003 [Candidatus Uhrbacteria bacterium GW2011_GWA2_42_220]|nr:MAG: hypothetical protein UV15_C0029G0003 [Candidatus Uhrbacteria bacterium GW2011_GWA2_42_220]
MPLRSFPERRVEGVSSDGKLKVESKKSELAVELDINEDEKTSFSVEVGNEEESGKLKVEEKGIDEEVKSKKLKVESVKSAEEIEKPNVKSTPVKTTRARDLLVIKAVPHALTTSVPVISGSIIHKEEEAEIEEHKKQLAQKSVVDNQKVQAAIIEKTAQLLFAPFKNAKQTQASVRKDIVSITNLQSR